MSRGIMCSSNVWTLLEQSEREVLQLLPWTICSFQQFPGGEKPARIAVLYRFKLIAYLLSVELNPFRTVCFFAKEVFPTGSTLLVFISPFSLRVRTTGGLHTWYLKDQIKVCHFRICKNLLCILASVILITIFWKKSIAIIFLQLGNEAESSMTWQRVQQLARGHRGSKRYSI